MPDQNEVFRHLLEDSPLLFFSYSVSTGQVLYVNATYERLFAPARRDDVNHDLPALLRYLPAEDRDYARHCLSQLAAGNMHDELLLRLRPEPDDALRWLCLRAHRTVASDGQVLLHGTVQDVTAEQEYTRAADQFMTRKSATLDILAHDLTGPFNLLRQVAEFFREKTEHLHDPQLNQLVQVMQDTCQGGVGLIREFVDSELAELVNVPLKRVQLDIVASLCQAVETFQQTETGRHFSFRSSAAAILVEADSEKVGKVIQHLLSNASKFTRDGGHIAVAVEQQPQGVLVSVADDGIGIPEKLQPVLFDRFTKARRPGLRGEKPIGLGMAIVQGLVRQHQGHLWFESQENAGTTFYFTLPM